MRLTLGVKLAALLLTFYGSCIQAGAWGIKSYENDQSLDWVAQLTDKNLVNKIENALNSVKGRYIESYYCEVALAASEIIAFSFTGKEYSIPKSVIQLAKNTEPERFKALGKKAMHVVDMCLNQKKSELAELWIDSDAQDWVKYTKLLKHDIEGENRQ